MSGMDPRNGTEFIHVDSSSGGWGACEGHDGESTLIAVVDGDSKNIPAEIVEHKYPLRLLQFSLIPDSGGPGKFRGGLGHVRDFQSLADSLVVLTSIERHNYRPWGLYGGLEGGVNDAVLNPGAAGSREVRKVTNFPLRIGDILSVRSGGGGGYGPPWERDVKRVLHDVAEGYVSLESAREDYKAAISGKGSALSIDEDATRALRSRAKQKEGK